MAKGHHPRLPAWRVSPVAKMRDAPVRELSSMIAQAQPIEQAQEVANGVRVIKKKNARRNAAPIRVQSRRRNINV